MAGDLLPPAVVPVALEEAKAFLRIDDTREDALIAGFVRSATALAEAFTGQCLIVRDRADGVAAVRTWQRLAAAPVVAITGITTDGVPLAGTAFEIDIDLADNGWVRLVAPDPTLKFVVTYSAGLAADWNGIPEPLRQGIVRLVSHFHAHRDAPDAVGAPAAVCRTLAAVAADATGIGAASWMKSSPAACAKLSSSSRGWPVPPGAWGGGCVAWAALQPVQDFQLVDVGERRIGRPRYHLTLRTPTAATVSSRFRWRGRLLVVVRAEPDPRTRDRLTFLVEDRT